MVEYEIGETLAETIFSVVIGVAIVVMAGYAGITSLFMILARKD